MNTDIAALQSFFAQAPFVADLGIEPIACDSGRVTTQLNVAARHMQHAGVVHAGVIGAMADHTNGAAVQTMAADGHWVLTAEFKISLLPAVRGQRPERVCAVIKPGRQVCCTEAEVFAIDGEQRTLVAKASATMAVAKA
jgi:uncharacterized protein (TIGR00369 family)